MKSYRTLRRDSKTQGSKDKKIVAPHRRDVTMEACEGRRMFSTYTVTTSADSGAGSLRDAINQANKHIGADTVNFKIGYGKQTIRPNSSLPTLLDVTTLDATTQPGYNGTPQIELTGDKAGGYGLNVSGGNSTVKGLIINRFSTGILVYKNGGNTITNCFVGTGSKGEKWIGNADKGIIVQTAYNTISNSVISGNGTMGVQLYTGTAHHNTLVGNKIGTDAAGTSAVPNGLSGVAVYGAANNTIGGTYAGLRNVISGNKQDGVVISVGGATNNVVLGNYVGTDVTGTKDLGNGNYGVEVSQPNNTVGGTAYGSANVVSGNDYSGVVLWLGSGSNNKVLNNYLGTNASGSAGIGNGWSGIDISNGSSSNTVSGNLISGNWKDGVLIYQGTNNTIKSNTIGYNATKSYTIANGRDGIRLINTTQDPILSNSIANQLGYGILRVGGGTFGSVSGNVVKDTQFDFKA